MRKDIMHFELQCRCKREVRFPKTIRTFYQAYTSRFISPLFDTEGNLPRHAWSSLYLGLQYRANINIASMQ